MRIGAVEVSSTSKLWSLYEGGSSVVVYGIYTTARGTGSNAHRPQYTIVQYLHLICSGATLLPLQSSPDASP